MSVSQRVSHLCFELGDNGLEFLHFLLLLEKLLAGLLQLNQG